MSITCTSDPRDSAPANNSYQVRIVDRDGRAVCQCHVLKVSRNFLKKKKLRAAAAPLWSIKSDKRNNLLENEDTVDISMDFFYIKYIIILRIDRLI